jgi:hypothetical protein
MFKAGKSPQLLIYICSTGKIHAKACCINQELMCQSLHSTKNTGSKTSVKARTASMN